MRTRMICGVLAAIAFPLPAAASEVKDGPICTDRPTKANAVCTVPVGSWQLESSAASWSKAEADGVETEAVTLGASVVKVGLSERSDLQIGMAPMVSVETEAAGEESRHSGAGDLTIRYKHRLTSDGATVQVAAIPFVKIPTADGDIGNGKAEGGLAVPISMAAGAVTVVLGPELDVLADADGGRSSSCAGQFGQCFGAGGAGSDADRRTLDDDQFRSGGPGNASLGRRGPRLARQQSRSTRPGREPWAEPEHGRRRSLCRGERAILTGTRKPPAGGQSGARYAAENRGAGFPRSLNDARTIQLR